MTGSDRDGGGAPRTVHDGIFKRLFSDPALAAQELRAVLPPALVASIDWATMQPMPASFVDAVFRQSLVDLAYRARFAGGGDMVLWLLEHQSTDDHWMLQRIVDSKSRMWWSWRRLHPEARHLPVIVPVVIYNGPRPWRAPRDMLALYGLSDGVRAALGPYVLTFSLVLDDLCAVEDAALRARRMDAYARLCLFAMARAAAEDFLDRLQHWQLELRLVFDAGKAEDIESFMLYTLYVHRHTDPGTTRERIVAVAGPEHEDVMLSVAEQLIKEGFDKGIDKGIEKGQRALLLRLLDRRFGAVPPQLAARVDTASPAEIEGWVDRVIDAATLDDVFRAP
jgi:hypothetical protein